MPNLGGNRVYHGVFENREKANPCLHFFASSFARGFSCVDSGFGQVLKSDPLVSSAFGRTRIGAPRRTLEKTSGTQGTYAYHCLMKIKSLNIKRELQSQLPLKI